MIQSPCSSGPIQYLETIQNRVLRVVNYKCNIPRLPHTSFKHLLLYLKLDNLQARRIKQDLFFIYKLLNGYIYCSDLLSNFTFLVPDHTTR